MKATHAILILFAATTAFYPLYTLLVFMFDLVLGSATMWQSFLFESKRQSLYLFVDDWIHAVPVAFAVALCFVLPTILLFHLRSALSAICYALFATGIATIALIVNDAPPAMVVILLASLTAVTILCACCLYLWRGHEAIS